MTGKGRDRRRSRILLLAGTTSIAAVVASAAWLGLSTGGGVDRASETPPDRAVPRSTADVTVATLRSSQRFAGDLDFGVSRDVTASRDGTVTWVPAPGSLLGSGEVLWRIDEQPTIYLVGDLPLYRDLVRGIDRGPDIEQLETLLANHGFGPEGWVADDRFDWATTNAVRDFEKRFGLTVDGRLTSSEIVIGTGPLRVASTGRIGDRVTGGSTVLTVTGTAAEVTALVSSRQYAWLQDKTEVTVGLPDGSTSVARYVGATATADDTGDLQYRVTYAVEGLDSEPQPVEVVVEETVAADALTVPVDALVALVEGGYAVEKVDGETTALLAVEVIGFDDAVVAVTGPLGPGDRVVVP
ncbi:MAG: peptidoglycan-binding protein [Acidimicrobiales bacterium]